jgi:hypothetical protein
VGLAYSHFANIHILSQLAIKNALKHKMAINNFTLELQK